jgi:hypothetical protein
MSQKTFTKGFLDGWSYLRGDEPAPPAPAFSVESGSEPYRAGIAHGVREACSKAHPKSTVTGTSPIDGWIDCALRRGATDCVDAPGLGSPAPRGRRKWAAPGAALRPAIRTPRGVGE